MVDDVRNFNETAESKEALDRSRLARERREAEQRKRLDELRAHAAAAQAQREKRDEDRRKRQAEQRAKDDDRRVQVEERKRAIWEASISRREALLQRERDRAERMERARAARSAPRPAFAFGSSTPRLLDPLDSAGFFWAARSTNPIDQMNFFESLAASTTNVMFVSAPLTRRASALQLDTSDTDNKDEPDRQQAPPMWTSVARRRTDLVPTVPLGRAPGRAHSMTRLDRLPAQRPIHSASPSMHHLNRTQCRSGESTPGSRPGSALSNAALATPGAGLAIGAGGVVRRPTSAHRKPRPASIAGTGVNTPRAGVGGGGGGGDALSQSLATTPSVSRDSTVVAGGDAPRRPASTPRRPRPASVHAPHRQPHSQTASPATPGEGKPPVHRKPKPSKEHDKGGRGRGTAASPGRALSPAPIASKDSSVDKDLPIKSIASEELPVVGTTPTADRSQVSAAEVTQKLEALQVTTETVHEQTMQNGESAEMKVETKAEQVENIIEDVKPEPAKPVELPKPVEKKQEIEEKKEPSQEKTEENEMTASMSRRITTEEQAKAALAERRRKAREELERQAEIERQRLQREAEEEAERQRLEEERQRRDEEEARELAQLQRRMEEEKLRKAIEAQQQLEREEAERKSREEAERQARLRDDEEKRRAAEEAERVRREEAEREERERLVRKQRVEAIMARTRLRKAEEEKKQQEKAQSQATSAAIPAPAAPVQEAASDPVAQEEAPAAPAQELTPAAEASAENRDNGNVTTGDLLNFGSSQADGTKTATEESQTNTETGEAKVTVTPNNGNVTADLLGLSEQNNTEDTIQEQSTQKQIDKATSNNEHHSETNNGNVRAGQQQSAIAHISASFLQSERAALETQTKMADVPKLLDDDFTTHNGHTHPLTLQNAI